MLSKKICMSCIAKTEVIAAKWNVYDEANWKEGFVYCPKAQITDVQSIIEEPNDRCPYVLEHLMEEMKC